MTEYQIAQDLDDSYELSAGGNFPTDGFIWMGDSLGDLLDGYRFQNIAIPPGATINSATIKVVAQFNDTADVQTKIHCEAADNAIAFTATGDDIGDRAKTSASVDWDLPASWSVGDEFTSPDFKAVVQEVVDRGGWASGNALIVIVVDDGGTGAADLEDYGNAPSKAAILTVTHTPGAVTPSQTQSMVVG